MSGVGQPQTGSSVFTPAGRQIGVRYAVRDLAAPDAPIASHTVDGEPNPEYPAALQPRDRSRQASTIQIRQMAPRLQPERLGASASPQEGAPIVGPDQAVESGNGRLLAIRHAYDQNMPSAQAYRAWLEQQGYSTEGMAQPALIRERTTPLSDQDRLSFARESNISATAGMSATEQAKLDAGKLSRRFSTNMRAGTLPVLRTAISRAPLSARWRPLEKRTSFFYLMGLFQSKARRGIGMRCYNAPMAIPGSSGRWPRLAMTT